MYTTSAAAVCYTTLAAVEVFVRYKCSRSLLYKLWPHLKRCLFPLVPLVCFDSVSLRLEPISPGEERALPPGLCRFLILAGFPCIHMCCEPCARPNSLLPGSDERRVHHGHRGLGTKLILYCRRARLSAARRVLSACAVRSCATQLAVPTVLVAGAQRPSSTGSYLGMALMSVGSTTGIVG